MVAAPVAVDAHDLGRDPAGDFVADLFDESLAFDEVA